MNTNQPNLTQTPSRGWRLAVVAFVLSAVTLALPLLTSVAYACQSSNGGGC